MEVVTKTAVLDAGGYRNVLLSVCPPNVTDRLPCDMCVVVDVSGSMQQEATIKDVHEAGAPWLSVLDIVRHAVKTVVHTLCPGDRLGIVAYSDTATTVLGLTDMSSGGKEAADQALKRLEANGQTNLWDGLHTGLEMLRCGARPAATAALLLLTDGVPNVEPAAGHLPALRQYRSQLGSKLPGTLHTFGFGKDLDSKLLHDLAGEGDGMYVFIPDASFVGTALVNCMANTLVTMGRNAQLMMKPGEGCKIEHVYGYGGVLTAGGDAMLSLGSLQFGQSNDVVLQMTAPGGCAGPFVRAVLQYDGPAGPVSVAIDAGQLASAGSAEGTELRVQLHRLRLVETISAAVNLAGPLGEGLQAAAQEVERLSRSLEEDSGEPRVKALKEDADGQVTEALSRRDWYQGWGAHYLRSLSRAHLLQQCNNFKDPGVQVYGGALFERVREQADDTFLALPPPSQQEVAKVQMLVAMGFSESQAQRALEAAYDNAELAAQYLMEGIPSRPTAPPRPTAAAPAPAYSMRAFYDSAGPCFSGDSMVLLASGEEKRLSELKRGDRVASRDGSPAEVVCTVETRTTGQAHLVELAPGLRATPWHPVHTGSAWAFPATVGCVQVRPCAAIYNAVLDRGHTLRVGGLWTVALGHGLEGEVVGHNFWGGPAVVESLRRLRGWSDGRVVLNPGCVLRDACGQACALRQVEVACDLEC